MVNCIRCPVLLVSFKLGTGPLPRSGYLNLGGLKSTHQIFLRGEAPALRLGWQCHGRMFWPPPYIMSRGTCQLFQDFVLFRPGFSSPFLFVRISPSLVPVLLVSSPLCLSLWSCLVSASRCCCLHPGFWS